MSALRYGQMELTVEIVTPAVAKKWLERNTGNRRLRDSTIEQYARDMAARNWERKPIPVCFDEDTALGNGQHTLTAIVRSGKTQELLVARKVPRKAIAVMDRGLARTLNDVAKFLDADIESRRATVARILVWGPRDQGGKSFDELLAAYLDHTEVIDFVCTAAPTKSAGMNATMLAVCAKAAYTCDRLKITRFLTVMRTGVVDGPHESAAIRMRDFARSLRGANSQALREETYNKAMSALRHFLEGRGMTKLYGTTEDLFPTPLRAHPQPAGRPTA